MPKDKDRAPKRSIDKVSGSVAEEPTVGAKKARVRSLKQRALAAYGELLRVKVAPEKNSFGEAGRPTTYDPKSIANKMLENYRSGNVALFGIEELKSAIKEADQAYLLTYAAILDNLLAGRDGYEGIARSAKVSLQTRIEWGRLPVLPIHSVAVAASTSTFFGSTSDGVAGAGDSSGEKVDSKSAAGGGGAGDGDGDGDGEAMGSSLAASGCAVG